MTSVSEAIPDETIRRVAKEGLEARNLLNFIADGTPDEMKLSKKPPTSPRPQSVSPKPPSFELNKGINARLLPRSSKRRTTLSRPKSRLRSASAGRNPEKDLRARYWTFLFENLHRAVDEIYQTCEMDESIVESKEAIMMLENYSKDFHALIQYININKDYETTAPLNRPTSLAWEVRKSSPGKSLLKNVFIEKLTAGSNAKRMLCFDTTSEIATTTKVESISENQKDIKEDDVNSILDSKESEIPVDELKKLDLSNEPLKACDIKICVIPVAEDPNFHCNTRVVVKEVCCQENQGPPQGTIQVETEKEDYLGKPSENANICSHDVTGAPDIVLSNEGVDKPNEAKMELKLQRTQSLELSKGESSNLDASKDQTTTNQINGTDCKLQRTKPSELFKRESSNFGASKTQTTINQVNANDTDCKPLLRRSKSSVSETGGVNKISTGRKADIAVTKKALIINNVKNRTTTSVKEKITSHDKMIQTLATKKVSSFTSTEAKVPSKRECHVNINSSNKECTGINPVSNESTRLMSSKSSQTRSCVSKSAPIPTKPAANDYSKNLTKNLPPGAVIKSETPKLTNVRKYNMKTDPNNTDKQKPSKPHGSESAIKRNISYVSSLSTKNHLEKSVNEVKKTSRPSSNSLKLSQKSGSMTSLNKTLISMSARKTSSVEKIPEALKVNADDDSDGWEMVRGRNRSRNSPAKKIPFLNQESQAVQIAKLNQSRIGGFPYTNKTLSNLKFSVKTTKSTDTPKKGLRQENKNEENKKEIDVNFQNGDSKSMSTPSNTTGDSTKTLTGSTKSTRIKKIGIDDKNKLKDDAVDNSSDNILFGEVWLNNFSKKFFRLDRTSGKTVSKFSCDNFLSNRLSRSSSTPDLHSQLELGSHKLTKTLCISDQSLGSQKYININILKKKLLEKVTNSTKKKAKKTKITVDSSKEMNSPNGSLDESDNGLTSDDQDGIMSHDEFDVQCQELYDTAWKYKILEQQVRKLELSWGEQMDLFDMELRTPGRALEMHEKLSSPFRKKSLLESIRLCNEKQLKAQEQRERLLEEKAQKFKIIEKKRLEMKSLIEERQEKQRVIMEQKLQRAEEKRKKQLQMIIRKAHDEKEKVNEIAFINTLEAQNKRHDLIIKEKDHEARLHDIQEERQRKQEEKAAKEAAAEERRKVLEAERLARLNEMQAKRKMRDHKVEQLFLVKEKERQELANQKARERELRISALNAQQQITIEELQKKIQFKQEESARRHEENMEQIRQKAFELSVRRCSSNNDDVPQPVPYETKKICTICNVLIGSEVYLLSHLHGKKHQEAVKNQYQGQDPSSEELELYNLKHIVDASTDQLDPNIALDKERQKALKKRCKKLRQRMSNRGQEYESQYMKMAESVNSSVKAKMDKIMNEIKKISVIKEKSSMEPNIFSSLERCLNDTDSLFKKQLSNNKVAFQAAGGVNALVNIFSIISMHQAGNNAFLSKKTINHLSNTTESLIDKSHDICKFILFSNKIGNLLDFLIYRLNHLIPDNICQLIVNNMTKSGEMNIKVDIAAWKLIHLLTGILINLSVEYSCTQNEENKEKSSDFQIRMQDMISYIVSIGIVDKLSQFFNSIQVPISNEEEIAAFLLDCIHFLTTLIKLSADCFSTSTHHKTEDSTQLVATFRVTNMVGVVSFLYGLLLHNGSLSRGEEPPPRLSKQIEVLAHSAIQMFNHMAVMNLQAFQSILGSEGLSLQLRHIVSHLLWYCSHLTTEDLLHEIILLVGYFTVLNPENQSIIQAGQRPTVLQQLCCLPFLYFSDPELTDILFPTLIACCYNNSANKAILQQEMTSELLSNYIEVKYLNWGDSNSISNKSKNSIADISFKKYWSFSVRFPKCHWSPAKQYFSVQ